jgi:hypothetical protein
MRISLTILILLGLLSFACHQKTPEEVEDIISKSSSLQRVNELCSQLPKPDNFRFVRKGLAGNSITAAVAFYYMTYEDPEKTRAFYKNWAKENGWQLTEGNQFKKGKQTFLIEFTPMENSNFDIMCKEPL